MSDLRLRVQERCAECGGTFGAFPAPREKLGAWVCSGQCALNRRVRLIGYTTSDTESNQP